ncbi:hypothetical protein UlMin_021324 [Ulmus minor]
MRPKALIPIVEQFMQSFGLFLACYPTFYRIIRRKAVEEFKPDPYLATVLNCLLWVFYDMPFVHPDSLLVVTINSVKKVCYWLCAVVVLYTIVILVTMLAFHNTKNRSLFVGILCDIFNIIMYLSPLTVMFKVIQTKSVEYMPFTLSLANFLNGCVWTAYALIKLDIYVLNHFSFNIIFWLSTLMFRVCVVMDRGNWEKKQDRKA